MKSDSKSYQTDYDYDSIFSLVIVAVVSYLLLSNAVSVGVTIIWYFLVAHDLNKGIFNDSGIEVVYPLRFYSRKRVIAYSEVLSIKKRSGAYIEQLRLVVRLRGRRLGRKIVLVYPDDEAEKGIEEILRSKNLELIKYLF